MPFRVRRFDKSPGTTSRYGVPTIDEYGVGAMFPLSTAVFRKLKSCPSAEILLCSLREFPVPEEGRKVAHHLTICDFCEAEMQLLVRHFPFSTSCDVPSNIVAVPTHLRRLAEDLLAQPEIATAKIAESFFEREPLTLTDA